MKEEKKYCNLQDSQGRNVARYDHIPTDEEVLRDVAGLGVYRLTTEVAVYDIRRQVVR